MPAGFIYAIRGGFYVSDKEKKIRGQEMRSRISVSRSERNKLSQSLRNLRTFPALSSTLFKSVEDLAMGSSVVALSLFLYRTWRGTVCDPPKFSGFASFRKNVVYLFIRPFVDDLETR